ncbi:MAG: acyltransferase [Synoicihabitans sp.]
MSGLPHRVGAIDVLRGGAVLGVIFTHCAFVVPAIGDFWFRIFRSGQYGVDLFFVISGFVLTESVHRRGAKSGGSEQWGFLRRRMMRLFPLYWLGVVVFGFLIEDRLVLRIGETPPFAWLGNVLLLNGLQPGWENRVVPGGWSIGAEAVFAVVFALIYPKVKGLRSAIVVWIMALVVSMGLAPTLSRVIAEILGLGGDADSAFFSLYYLPTFAAGMVVWHLKQSFPRNRISTVVAGSLALAGVAVVLARSFGWGTDWDRGLVVGAAMGLIVLGGSQLTASSTLGQGLAWIGRLSYGAYLVHFAMIGLAETVLVTLLPITTPMMVMFGLLVLMVSGLTFPVAWALENPRAVLTRFGARKSSESD